MLAPVKWKMSSVNKEEEEEEVSGLQTEYALCWRGV